ncbi:MAG: serine/threonine protein kinase [Planctomycetales bacterium]|nr:serine/threonine protein kinase [Planctomycetales bacterium]
MANPSRENNSVILARALEQRLIDNTLAAELLLQLQNNDASMPLDVQLVSRGLITPAQRSALIEGLGDTAPGGGTLCLSPSQQNTPVDTPINSADLSASASLRAQASSTGAAGAATKVDFGTGAPPADLPERRERDRYDWEAEHARGGLGAVWRGWDRQLERHVALKVLQPKAAKSRKMRRRFVDEAMITGQLEHPGIVPVYDLRAGGAKGFEGPYYAMRMLTGKTLSDELKRLNELPTKSPEAQLQRHALLMAFVSVCDTIAYAHRQRVLHRDIKPSNIILGDYGEVLVVDWGLAKRLPENQQHEGTRIIGSADVPATSNASRSQSSGVDSSTGLQSGSRTLHGEVLGTPLYMSPEQASGKTNLTVASDIFSLGVILYELLTGEKAFAAEDTQTILRRVKEAQYQAPRQITKRVPRPLEAICIKALARDPAQRYPSAAELGAEVRRHLAGERVQSYSESLGERLLRWSGKNRPLVLTLIAATAFTAIVATGACLVVDAARRDETRAKLAAQQAHREEQAARKREEQAKHWALAQIQQTRQAADSWLLDWSGDLQFYPGLQPIRVDLLKKAESHYVETYTAAKDRTEPAVVLESCRSLVRLGDVRRLLGPAAPQRDALGAPYELALVSLTKLLELDALNAELAESARVQRCRAATGIALGVAEQGDPAACRAALEQLSQAATLPQLTDSTPSPSAASPANHTTQPDRHDAMSRRQAALARAGIAESRLRAALGETDRADQALATAQRTLAFLDSKSPRDQALLTSVLLERGQSASERGDLAGADSLYQLAADLLASRCQGDAKRPDVWETRALCELLRGEVRERRSMQREAEQHYRQSLDCFREMLKCLYGDDYLNENIAIARINLARMCAAEKPLDAIEHLLAARDELVTLIRRDGARASWVSHLRRCLTTLVELQQSQQQDAAENRQLLEALSP